MEKYLNKKTLALTILAVFAIVVVGFTLGSAISVLITNPIGVLSAVGVCVALTAVIWAAMTVFMYDA